MAVSTASFAYSNGSPAFANKGLTPAGTVTVDAPQLVLPPNESPEKLHGNFIATEKEDDDLLYGISDEQYKFLNEMYAAERANRKVGHASIEPLATASTSTSTPYVISLFDGNWEWNSCGNGCGAPPDINAAVSPTQVVEPVNSSLAVYTRNGTLLKNTGYATFFNYTTTGMCDAVVQYDRTNNRWLFGAMSTQASNGTQYYFLAASQTSDATGAWYINKIPIYKTVGSGASIDFPHFGQTQNALVWASNVNGPTGQHTMVFGVLKSTLYSTSSYNIKYYKGLNPTVMSTYVMDSNPTAYLFSAQTGSNVVDIYQFSNPGASNQSLAGPLAPTVSRVMNTPPAIQQPNSTYTINNSNCQFSYNSIQLGNTVVNVNAINNSGNSSCLYVQYDIPSNTFPYSNTFNQTSTSQDWCPSIAEDDNGNLALTWSSVDLTAGTQAQMILSTSTVSAGGNIPPGTVVCQDAYPYQFNRWGDYTSVQLDPAAEGTFFAANEYVIAYPSSGTWGTKLAYFKNGTAPSITQVNLSSAYNQIGIYTDGSTFSGGLDGVGYALPAPPIALQKGYTFGPANALDVVEGTGQTVSLPAGTFSTLNLLATATNGGQTSQSFVVHFSDGTSTTFTQSISDWANSGVMNSGESVNFSTARNVSNGTYDSTTVHAYQYSFALNNTKTVTGITLPNNSNVKVLAIDLVP
jgi:hypothetical protein